MAKNTHTVGEWWHGLGDGANNNDYVYPFNNNDKGHKHENTVRLGYVKDGDNVLTIVKTRKRSSAKNGFTWDTAPVNECRFASIHWSVGKHALNKNGHPHHNFCV